MWLVSGTPITIVILYHNQPLLQTLTITVLRVVSLIVLCQIGVCFGSVLFYIVALGPLDKIVEYIHFNQWKPILPF